MISRLRIPATSGGKGQPAGSHGPPMTCHIALAVEEVRPENAGHRQDWGAALFVGPSLEAVSVPGNPPANRTHEGTGGMVQTLPDKRPAGPSLQAD